jgi:uncharacterized protein with von Willebrand factor type A (vWA) domain
VSDAPATVRTRLATLAGVLRAGGVRVGTGEVETALRALAAVDAGSRVVAYLALRPVLCSRREDLAAFDAAFAAVFDAGAAERGADAGPGLPPGGAPALPRVAIPPAPGADAPTGEPVVRPAAYSDAELLRDKDFADYTDAERQEARALIARLAVRGPQRPSRRTRASHRRGTRPTGARHDLRRTMRASLRYGGEPVERRWRERTERERPLVLVCDVSGSMDPYARMLLMYLQAWVAARRRVEAFVFGTRLTRVTRELAGRDPDLAVARAAAAVSDWSGGTRIGDSLAELNREHGRRIGRGSVAIVLSDGWDRGDPDVLADEMARLKRCSHSVIWLNPLKAHERYEPLTRGMRAALPHIDHFLAGNSISSLEELAELMEGGLA